MKKIRFTKKSLSLLSVPAKGYAEYADTEEKALKLVITKKGTKTFYFRRTIGKKTYRFKIAAAENGVSLAEIRRRTAELRFKLEQTSAGICQDHRLKELCDKYIFNFAMHEKLTWKEDLKDFRTFLSPWFTRRISDISRNDILLLHRKITVCNGPCRANRILAKISALFSKAREWGWAADNPASHIRRNKEMQRDRFLSSEELKRFFRSMDQEPDSLFKSMIWIALLTGVRRDNIRTMKWEQIDFHTRIWTIPRTKNGRPLTVCLPDQAVGVLKNIPRVSQWVFPSKKSASGHIMDHRRTLNRILKRAEISNLHLHDLRRTLASWMAINGTSLYIIADVLGHSSTRCTQIYARLNNCIRKQSLCEAVDKMLSFQN